MRRGGGGWQGSRGFGGGRRCGWGPQLLEYLVGRVAESRCLALAVEKAERAQEGVGVAVEGLRGGIGVESVCIGVGGKERGTG